MKDALMRYAIGALLGFAFGALTLWQWAHRNVDRVLDDWDRAVQIQIDAERKRTQRIYKETIDGLTADRDQLRRRLASGWKPAIPTAPTLPASGVPDAAPGTHAAPAAGLPGAAGDAAGRLATCQAERERLIADGQETVLRCQALMGWVERVGSDGR